MARNSLARALMAALLCLPFLPAQEEPQRPPSPLDIPENPPPHLPQTTRYLATLQGHQTRLAAIQAHPHLPPG